ncbi:LysR substrate-binding domain-containing protein [Bordetella sp. BOR01]|uniref:LysR family transcriptional regulator n=1 Tax=Bordetella sp. BOR01 TaxID=2854779 RepID=UPI001C45414F|nr:LysR substrate-binding domain-containing protein [Bordetella sp. BOR01]MBV7485309.1 LysR family transcriptional regulator [Bordetella sp. BOR01]
MINVRHLEVFRTVVKTGSVSAAGRMLYVSQPAVTKTLRLLEAELGLTLFLRVRGRLVCTPEADALMPEVERLFGSVASVQHAASEIRQGIRGRITVAAVSTLAMSMVARAVGRYAQAHPEVSFDVRALPTRHVVEYVNNSQVDMGILDVSAPTGTLEIEEFCSSELAAILHRSHPLARHATLTPKLLRGQPLISFADDTLTGWRLREAFRQTSVDYATRLVSNSTVTTYAMVEPLRAVALVDPFTLMSNAWPDLVQRRFAPTIDIRPRFLFQRERPRPLVVRMFTQTLREVAHEMTAGKLQPLA